MAAPPPRENEAKPQNVPPALVEKPTGMPPGKYKLVGLEVITTGRRLIDEICQIAAYIPPKAEYSQYIMPFGDLNTSSRRRNHLRVATVGRYRMLKETVSHKVLKTKSEVTALAEFLDWLEANKTVDEKIILLYHEPRRLYPKMIIQGMIRHKLIERFENIVAGFTDSYALCHERCLGSVKSVALQLLATLLLDEKSQSLVTALDRAEATYKIIEQLANQEGERLDIAAGGAAAAELQRAAASEMMDLAIEFGRPVSTERIDLEALKALLERQNSYSSMLRPMMSYPRPQRRRFTHMRRVLADAGLLFYQFKDAWHEGRRAGMERLMGPLEETVKAEDVQELLDIFEYHFEEEQAARRRVTSALNPPTPMLEEALPLSPEEFYFSSDSDNSGQESASFGVDNLAATIAMSEEDT